MFGKILGATLVAIPAIGFTVFKLAFGGSGDSLISDPQISKEIEDAQNEIRKACEDRAGSVSCSHETTQRIVQERCVNVSIGNNRPSSSGNVVEETSQCLISTQVTSSVDRR